MKNLDITRGTNVTVMLPAPKEMIREMMLYVYPPSDHYYHQVNERLVARDDVRGADKGVQTQKFDVESLGTGKDMLIGLGQGHLHMAMIEVANIGKVNQNDKNESFRFKLVSTRGSTRTEMTAYRNAIRQVHYTLKS